MITTAPHKPHRNTLQHTICYSVSTILYSIFNIHHASWLLLHYTAPHCTTLQHTVAYCNTQFIFQFSLFCIQSSVFIIKYTSWLLSEQRDTTVASLLQLYCTALHHTAPHCTTQFVIQYSLFFTHSSIWLLSPHRLHVCHLGADFSRRDVDGVFSIGTCVSCHSRFRLAAGVFLKNKYKEANPHVSWQALYACIHSTYEFIHTVLAMKFVYFINVCMHT